MHFLSLVDTSRTLEPDATGPSPSASSPAGDPLPRARSERPAAPRPRATPRRHTGRPMRETASRRRHHRERERRNLPRTVAPPPRGWQSMHLLRSRSQGSSGPDGTFVACVLRRSVQLERAAGASCTRLVRLLPPRVDADARLAVRHAARTFKGRMSLGVRWRARARLLDRAGPCRDDHLAASTLGRTSGSGCAEPEGVGFRAPTGAFAPRAIRRVSRGAA
jgi:hypothetical protein